jgi:hypothetical protein
VEKNPGIKPTADSFGVDFNKEDFRRDFQKHLLLRLPSDKFSRFEEKPPSKRRQKREKKVALITEKREEQIQDIGYLNRSFVLCGLPFKPKEGASYYERINGDIKLKITASPEYGLPFGADILVIIWVATLARKKMIETNSTKCPRVISFESGAQLLDAFGLPKDGASYKRLQERIMRVFHSTYFVGKVGKRSSGYGFRYFDGYDLWSPPNNSHVPASGQNPAPILVVGANVR